MHVTLDRNHDGGAILLDRLYRFNPNGPIGNGELAIVVTHDGRLRAAAIEDVDSTKRTAWMRVDGPGRELAERWKVHIIGTVTGSFPCDDTTGFPITARTALDITAAASTGHGLRERVRAEIAKAAGEGLRVARLPGGGSVTKEEFLKLEAELKAAGFLLSHDSGHLRVDWYEPSDGL